MTRALLLILCLSTLAFSATACHLPCGEPFWKKRQSLACEVEKPAW